MNILWEIFSEFHERMNKQPEQFGMTCISNANIIGNHQNKYQIHCVYGWKWKVAFIYSIATKSSRIINPSKWMNP